MNDQMPRRFTQPPPASDPSEQDRMHDHSSPFWEKGMHAKSPLDTPFAAPPTQFDMPSMPNELLLQIVLHIRDSASMCSLARTSSRFATLSREPAFVGAMTDCVFSEQLALLDKLEMSDRVMGIYQLACRMAKRMQPSHLKQMMACLDFPDEEESDSEDNGPAAAEGDEPISTSALLRAGIAGAIHSGSIEGFNAEVMQHTAELVDRMPWERIAQSKRMLPLPTDTDAEIELFIDALSGIWGRLSTATTPSVSKGKKRSVATYALSCVAELPMEPKLPLLKAIMQSAVMQSDRMTRFILRTFLERSASHPETLEVPLAEELFGMLGTIVDEMIESDSTMSEAHLLFAKMLPQVRWRENSKRALAWLMKALPRARNGLSRQTIERAIPVGVFSDKEIAYLARSLLDGSFSWDALEKTDPDGGGRL